MASFSCAGCGSQFVSEGMEGNTIVPPPHAGGEEQCDSEIAYRMAAQTCEAGGQAS